MFPCYGHAFPMAQLIFKSIEVAEMAIAAKVHDANARNRVP